MEEPECRVSGMIQALLSTLREHVWQQAVADVSGKGAQDPARLGVAPGDQVSPSKLIMVSRPQSLNQW